MNSHNEHEEQGGIRETPLHPRAYSDQERQWMEDIGDDKELWQIPEAIPEKLAARMPGEKEVDSLWELEYKELGGVTKDRVRGIVNFRRKVRYHRWLNGYYDAYPEELEKEP